MRRVVLTTLLGLSVVTATLAQAPSAGSNRPSVPVIIAPVTNAALVSQYCATCHSERGKAGELSLAGFDPDRAPEHPATAEKMIRKLRAGMMPPPGARRPSPDALMALASAMESKLDAASVANPDPGWRPFQRLNRAEYAREVKRLLSLDVDVSAFLPADTVSNGFDNIADSQTFSPTLMEGYLRAASRITMLAIGDPDSSPSQATYKVSKATSQLARVDGAPLGTRGGVSVVHTFPADGDYIFSADFYAEPLGLLFGSTSTGEQLEVSIDGARAALFDINPRMSEEKTGLQVKSPAVHVQAGPRRVTAAFINRSEGLVNDLIAPIDHTLADTEIGIAYGITTLPHLRGLNIVGPQQTSGVSDTVSRRAVFTCRPTSAAEEAACASTIVRRLATEAFRRPVNAHDFESLMGFYERGRTHANFERGIGKALEAILASPQFLFKLEEPPPGTTGTRYRLADMSLASRLSFFLWGSGPDQELQRIASEGRLKTPGMMSRQVTRMLADDRAEALATRFASQWLRLQDLDQVLPDPIQFPYFDHTLGQAFRQETERFVDSLFREDRSVLDLLTADYTFVNERLARHYGIPDISGSVFQRVKLPDYRRGILGQGSVLTLTSIATRTSPVMRGKWVLEVLMGSPPPPPPPNVPPLDETKGTSGSRLLTVRERMEEHRKNPSCTSCHRVIDPVGLALENFDVTGKWRAKDGDVAVDASGTLYDGTAMDGPSGLREALLKHKDMFLMSFTENLMTYALGRRLEAYDMPAVRRIIRDAARQDYRIGAFINGVVNSVAFQSSRVPPAELSTTMAGSR
jgi:hypothetical protein